MTVFKSGIIIILLLFCLEQSTQISISSDNSENSTNMTATGCVQTIGHCLHKTPRSMALCVIKRAAKNMDCAIASNDTWHLNDYVSLKKNPEWKPVQLEARQQKTLIGLILTKLNDLLTSRSLQFSIPHENVDKHEGRRERSHYDLDGLDESRGLSSADASFETGRKKKKKGIMFGGIGVIAMIAQMLLGKIAFLAGASFLLSKIALFLSVANAFKKQTGGGSSGTEHVVYADQGHGGGSWQRSLPKGPDWQEKLLKK